MPRQERRLIVRGARGSIAMGGAAFSRYGGHTTCLEVEIGPRRRLVIDCGSGLMSVPADLPGQASSRGQAFDVLLTHYHVDHLVGLPMFPPLYDATATFTFYGHAFEGRGVRDALESLVSTPWFPVPIRETPSTKRYVELGDEPIAIDGLRISHGPLDHPQGVTAYRIDGERRSVVVATDCERGNAAADASLLALGSGADVLMHDAQYTPREYERRAGWGHSTWRHAVEAAIALGVGRLLLCHHDPRRTDEGIDAIVSEARSIFPNVDAAGEGMTIDL